MDDRLNLRESVTQYFADPALMAGVDALLKTPTKLPSDLSENELAPYIEALWSARQIQFEYALDLGALWAAVWGDVILNSRLTIIAPGEASARQDSNLHPEFLLANGDYVRIARTDRGDEIWLWVTLTAQGASCGCDLGDRGRLPGLNSVDGFDNSDAVPITTDGRINLAPLRKISRQLSNALANNSRHRSESRRKPTRTRN